MFKENDIFSELINRIGKCVYQIESENVRGDEVVISIPFYMIQGLINNAAINIGVYNDVGKDFYLYGKKVQIGYENKIVVFHKNCIISKVKPIYIPLDV